MWPVSLETAAWVGLLNGSPFHISDETPDVPMVMSRFALAGELGDGVYAVVHTVDSVFGSHVDAVGAVAEYALAEAADEVAALVEDHHGIVGVAAEGVNVVLRVNGHARRLYQTRALRHLVPVNNVFVLKVAFANYRAHAGISLRCV